MLDERNRPKGMWQCLGTDEKNGTCTCSSLFESIGLRSTCMAVEARCSSRASAGIEGFCYWWLIVYFYVENVGAVYFVCFGLFINLVIWLDVFRMPWWYCWCLMIVFLYLRVKIWLKHNHIAAYHKRRICLPDSEQSLCNLLVHDAISCMIFHKLSYTVNKAFILSILSSD